MSRASGGFVGGTVETRSESRRRSLAAQLGAVVDSGTTSTGALLSAPGDSSSREKEVAFASAGSPDGRRERGCPSPVVRESPTRSSGWKHRQLDCLAAFAGARHCGEPKMPLLAYDVECLFREILRKLGEVPYAERLRLAPRASPGSKREMGERPSHLRVPRTGAAGPRAGRHPLGR